MKVKGTTEVLRREILARPSCASAFLAVIAASPTLVHSTLAETVSMRCERERQYNQMAALRSSASS